MKTIRIEHTPADGGERFHIEVFANLTQWKALEALMWAIALHYFKHKQHGRIERVLEELTLRLEIEKNFLADK